MARKIAIMTNKGGVGKSTFTTNVAASLHTKEDKKRVLIVDLDGQGNCASAFNVIPDTLENTVYDCIMDNLPPEKAILSIKKNLDLLPANDDMNWWELDALSSLKGRDPFSFLINLFGKLDKQYDYIFVDSPPEMKVVAWNIMKIIDVIFIPYKPETFSVQGMIKVIRKIREAEKKLGSQIKIGGVVAMMVEERTKLHSDLLLQADTYCKKNGIPLLQTRIPKAIRYADAQRYGMPEVLANPKGTHSQIYMQLLEEVLTYSG